MRKQLGLTFLGETREDRLLLADVEIENLGAEVHVLSCNHAYSANPFASLHDSTGISGATTQRARKSVLVACAFVR